MRILIIHNQYKGARGGEDVVFEEELNLLRKNGNEVYTLVFNNSKINSLKDKLILLFNLFYNRSSAKKTKEIIKKFKPDVIHVHNFFFIASPSIFFVAKKMNIPIILTLHNYRLVCSNALLMRSGKVCEVCINKTFPLAGIKYSCYRKSKLETFLLTLNTAFHKIIGTWKTKVDSYIVLTNFAKSKIINSSLKLSENSISIKPNFSIDYGVGNEIRSDFFLYVGRLSNEKGIDILVESFKYQSYKLIIIGDGPERYKIESLVKSNSNVVFMGYQEKNIVIEKMKECKALIFPSICYEGFPVSILEAFSAGTPIIASHIGAMSEVIQDKVNGLHFKSGNAFDLAEKVKFFVDDNNDLYQLYINARETYISKYTPEENYRAILQIYTEAIKLKQ